MMRRRHAGNYSVADTQLTSQYLLQTIPLGRAWLGSTRRHRYLGIPTPSSLPPTRTYMEHLAAEALSHTPLRDDFDYMAAEASSHTPLRDLDTYFAAEASSRTPLRDDLPIASYAPEPGSRWRCPPPTCLSWTLAWSGVSACMLSLRLAPAELPPLVGMPASPVQEDARRVFTPPSGPP